MKVLILAGGTGTRLWPASRKKSPKQLLPFINDQTLLQNTFNRCRKITEPKNIFIGTLLSYADTIKQQLPEIPQANYSLEPIVKDRGPAIGLAALLIHELCGNSTFTTAWSDHHIKDESNYVETIKKAEDYLKKYPENIITIGVKPTFPQTGFGYIEKGEKINAESGLELYAVKSFREKPNEQTAKEYLASNSFLWNTGYFVWKTGTLLDLYKKHLPEVYELLMQIKPSIGTENQQEAINNFYEKMPKIDIEKGLIEKIDNRVVIEGNFTWSDIGNWKSLKEVLAEDSNLTHGHWIGIDTEDSLIYNYGKQLVTAVGLKNTIVVVTEDTILIADKDQAENVKQLTKLLEEDPKLEKFL